jgi:hypothetical protein
MTRAEALAKVGKRVAVHDLVDGAGKSWACYAKALPAGTTGRVIHAHPVPRGLAAEGGSAPGDTYEVVIAWEVADRRRDTCDKSDYELFLTELA